MRVLAEQRGRAHQHPGRAVAALQAVAVPEGLLQLVQLVAVGEAFDGLDGRAVGLHGEEHAALDQRAVDDHRAGAAVAGVAADVASGQVEIVAHEVDQQLARVDLPLVRRAVDRDRDRLGDLDHERSSACRTARTARTAARCDRYSAEAWTSEGGSKYAASTASRTASGSVESGWSTIGTASTQPGATVPVALSDAAALTMHVPSPPSVTAAKPSCRPAGIVTRLRTSPRPTAVRYTPRKKSDASTVRSPS